MARIEQFQQQLLKPEKARGAAGDDGPAADPFAARRREENLFDPAKAAAHRASCWASPWPSYRTSEGEDKFRVLPGDDVKLTFPTAGQPPKESSATTSRSSTSTRAR